MDAGTKLCCLIGNPVGHSISPLIHNSISEKMGINMVYTAFAVESDNVVEAVRGAYALGINGMNVTVPHKVAVMEALSQIDELAQRIGAVNTLVRAEDGFKGYNTDIIGLMRLLEDAGIEIKGNSFIILGAGGASRAIVYLCASCGADRIFLLNRSVDKAKQLAEEVNSFFPDIVEALPLKDYGRIPKGKYPVIQTTSVGLYPNCDVAPVEEDDFYELVSEGVDIICNPTNTKFMKLCAKHGAEAYNGLKMLLYQGVAAYELWNNVKVPRNICDEVLTLMEKEMQKNG